MIDTNPIKKQLTPPQTKQKQQTKYICPILFPHPIKFNIATLQVSKKAKLKKEEKKNIHKNVGSSYSINIPH